MFSIHTLVFVEIITCSSQIVHYDVNGVQLQLSRLGSHSSSHTCHRKHTEKLFLLASTSRPQHLDGSKKLLTSLCVQQATFLHQPSNMHSVVPLDSCSRPHGLMTLHLSLSKRNFAKPKHLSFKIQRYKYSHPTILHRHMLECKWNCSTRY